MSRALGDFEFKMNATLGPDDQIVTGMFVELKRIIGIDICSSYMKEMGFLTLALTSFQLANPVIVEHKLTEEDEFLVLACDGM